MNTLRSVADGLATIFVPIYLYQQGYTLSSVFLYYIVNSLAWLAALYLAAIMIKRIGPRPAIALSLFTNICQFALLVTLPSYHWPLWLIAIFGGFTTAFYWLGFRLMFTRAMAHHAVGKTVGVSTALLVLAGGIAPAIGGLVASFAGIKTVYLLAITLFACASVPLLLSPAYHTKNQDSQKFDIPGFKANLMANAMFNADDAAQSTIWPLLIFLILPSYAEVGALSSVTLLTVIAVSIYAGYHSRGRQLKHNIRAGTTIGAVGNGLRLFVQSGFHVFGVNLVSGFGKALALTPYMARYYTQVERGGMPYVVGMLSAGAVAYLIFFSIMFALSLFLTTSVTLLAGVLISTFLILGANKIT